MIFAETESFSPAYNLAFEEYICGLGLDVFMLWRNEPSVIVGKFQDIEEEVDTEFARAKGIQIVRRNSGGGAVYHDLGNVNYSFILRDERSLTLEYFSRIIMSILEKLGVSQLEFHHNDILVNGQKISGSAQYHHNGTILHHGTLLFDTELDVIPKVLRRCGKVANIKTLINKNISVADFMSFIRENMNLTGKLAKTTHCNFLHNSL